jgi:farnesyl-diphosphate farnesyltransferase
MIASHQELLKQTSRSFYLTLRVLPPAVRPQIALAYLLARTTDTIADTEVLPAQDRLNALGILRARIFGHTQEPLNFGKLAQHQGSPAERTLLERAEESLTLLRKLSTEDLALVRKVIDTITSGQELDLLRFETGNNQLVETPALTAALSPKESGQLTRIISLQTDAELDDYTYRVAGCVGEFWTNICRAHLFPAANLDDARLLQDGVRFGKGLQLVNILRDLPGDLAQGRCYIPSESLATAGLQPTDLLDLNSESRFRPVYDGLLDRAEAHLASGWNYTNSLPANQYRVRLACALPILIGVRTLARLREGKVLEPGHRIKVSRTEVKDLLVQTLVHLPWPSCFRDLWRPKQKPGA